MVRWEGWGFECEENWRFSWCDEGETGGNGASTELDEVNGVRLVLDEEDDDRGVLFVRAVAACVALAGVVFSYIAIVCNARGLKASTQRDRARLAPRGSAFSIAWSIIYTTSVISVGAQLLNLHPDVALYTANAASNFCYASAWVGCGLWVFVFAAGGDVDRPRSRLVCASVTLVGAAALALAAVGLERSVRSGDAARIAVVGFPYGIFAGWLVVAALLSINIAVAHTGARDDNNDDAGDAGDAGDVEGPGVLLAPPREETATFWERGVVVVTALGVAVAAATWPDPFLPLPLAFAISRMPIELTAARGLALGALLAASGVAVVLGALRVGL